MTVSIIVAIFVLGIAAYIDSKHQIVPNWLSVGGMVIGIILSSFIPSIHGASAWWLGALSAIGDCILVICLMCWYASLTERFLHCDTLGGGDVKIMGALATIVNFKLVICVLLVSPILGMIHYASERLKYQMFGLPYCPSIFAAFIFSIPFYNKIVSVI